jgi:D-3-phosphoglycerate dehydrogenase
MHRLWSERAVPSKFVPLLEGVAVTCGAAGAAREHVFDTVGDAQAVIASSLSRYDGAFADRFPAVRAICRTGIGVDNVAVPDMTARGVAVCNAPDAPTISTAEHAVTLMLAVLKHVKQADQAIRQGGQRDHFSEFRGEEANGRTLGLVGFGRVGRRVAHVAQALGMHVLVYDPALSSDVVGGLGCEWVARLEDLLGRADVVSLHMPLSDATRNVINAERLSCMKPGAYLINTARGGLVDMDALLAALESGRLGGAGLDVFPKEPPDPSLPLLQRSDVIATPHIAGATQASKDRLWHAAITQALQVLRGERPPHLVNPEVWPHLRAA